MSKRGKIWGVTETLLTTPFLLIERLTILPHARCSMHMHEHRANCFYLESGRLKIEVEKKDYPLLDVTWLGPREFTTVPPGEYHRFLTAGDETVHAIEMYYPEPYGSIASVIDGVRYLLARDLRESADIIRKDCGAVGEK